MIATLEVIVTLEVIATKPVRPFRQHRAGGAPAAMWLDGPSCPRRTVAFSQERYRAAAAKESETMELRGAPEGRPPEPAPSPGETAPGPLSSAGAAGTAAGATPAGGMASRREPAGAGPSTGDARVDETGDARVDEAVARLTDLAALPVAEHPAVFEYVHERLTEALGDLDTRDPAGPGGPGGTGGAGHVPGPPAPGG